MNLLFVCTGNTCRSPMAEALAKNKLKNADCGHWQVASAGIHAQNGMPVSPHAQEAAAAYGLDISGHQARQLVAEHFQVADRIYTMTKAQAESLKQLYPQYADHISPLASVDIIDPFGGNLMHYEHCIDELNRALDELFNDIHVL